MVENRGYGYFTNLEYFQMNDHFIATWNIRDSNTLTNEIVSYLFTICDDTRNLPKMREFE